MSALHLGRRCRLAVMPAAALAMAACTLLASDAHAGPAPTAPLDAAALSRVLLTADQSPPWYPAVSKVDPPRVNSTPRSIPVCVDLAAADPTTYLSTGQPSLAVMGILYYRRPAGWQQVQETVHQFESSAAADRVWADMQALGPRCQGSSSLLIPADPSSGEPASRIRIVQSVRTDRSAPGQPALVISSRTRLTPDGAQSPTLTTGGVRVWRKVGPAIIAVETIGAVRSDVASAVSLQEAATTNALSLILLERYLGQS